MAYNIVTTDEMDTLLENSVSYIINKLKNVQAASHLFLTTISSHLTDKEPREIKSLAQSHTANQLSQDGIQGV